MDVKFRSIFNGFLVLLVLIKDYNCYPFNGFYGCRDVFIWFQGEIVSCKYLMLPSRHGLHMDPKYYCTEYTAHRCCATCALLDRHNYRVMNGFYQETTSDSPTTSTDIYDYMRVNEIYKAPSIDMPVHSDIIKYKVLNNANEGKTTPATKPLPAEQNNYNIVNEVVTENATFIPEIVNNSNIEVNAVYKVKSARIPVTTARNADVYSVAKGRSTHITLFTAPHLTENKQLLTTESPLSIPSVSNINKTSEVGRIPEIPVLEGESNVSPNASGTVQPDQYTSKTVEQFFTIPPYLSQTVHFKSAKVDTTRNTQALMNTTTPLPVPLNQSSSFNFKTTIVSIKAPTLATTTRKPSGQEKRIRDGCVDVGIWIVNGSVPCEYLVQDNKYGLNRNQLYFCNRYPLTSCCVTCKRINNEFGNFNKIGIPIKGSKPTAKEMPEIHIKQVQDTHKSVYKDLQVITSTAIPSLFQDSTVLIPNQTTKKQNKNIPEQLTNTTEHVLTQMNSVKQGTVVVENVHEISEHPIALPLRQTSERTPEPIITKTLAVQKDKKMTPDQKAEKVNKIVNHMTKPQRLLSPLKPVQTSEATATKQQNTYLTTTSQTTKSKGTIKRRCEDIGIWFRSGSISCDYLIKDHKYKLNKHPLYYCNKYPLTSCCKTCALINMIIRS